MPIFSFAAVNAENSLTKGHIRALSAFHASLRLKAKGMLLINIKKESNQAWRRFFSWTPINGQDKIQLTHSLVTFLSSGLPLDRAVKIAREQTGNPRLASILEEVEQKIREGHPLSEALSPYEKHFSRYYVKMINVGESSGMLEETLDHLLAQMEKEAELISNIRSALIYPFFIIITAIAALVFLMTFVIPTIAEALNAYGGELPLLTKLLIGASDLFIVNWPWFALGAIVLPLIFIQTIKTRNGQRSFESLIFRLPAVAKIVIEFNNARIMRSLWTPLKSGLNINKAMELVAESCNNLHFRETIEQSAELIRRGIPLSEILKGYKKYYPPSVYGMLEVGENTGRIDDMLLRLAEYYEQSVQKAFKNISTVIEPFLILFIGLVIGLIAVSVLMPIWQFSETI